jgi:hypothetical protein
MMCTCTSSGIKDRPKIETQSSIDLKPCHAVAVSEIFLCPFDFFSRLDADVSQVLLLGMPPADAPQDNLVMLRWRVELMDLSEEYGKPTRWF